MGDYLITSVQSDTTKILPCREGDVFLWVQDKAPLLSLAADLDVADIWVTKNSDTVLFTNRLEDVPEWLPLRPEMVGGRNVHPMVKKLNDGFKLDQYDLGDAPESWKVNVHHYVIWVGDKRNDSDYNNGILAIFRFATGSLALLQNNDLDIDELTGGSSSDYNSHLTDEKVRNIRMALEFLEGQGKPRKYAEKWTLG